MSLFNQKGQTLVVVLLTITLISIFASVMTAQALNGSKQVAQTEHMQKATDAAEMGIDYFVEDIIKKVDFRNNTLHKNPCEYIFDVVTTLPATNPSSSQMMGSGTSFVLRDYQCEQSNKVFSFVSKGISNTTEKELKVSFPITIIQNFPNPPSGLITCQNGTNSPCDFTDHTKFNSGVYFPSGLDINKVRGSSTTVTALDDIFVYGKVKLVGENNPNNPYACLENSNSLCKNGLSEYELWVKKDLYIDGGADIEGSNIVVENHGTIYVGRDLHINWGLDDANHGDIIVKRDAYFYQKTILTKPNSFVCVKGTLFMPEGSDFNLVKPLGGRTCEDLRELNGSNNKGIYADYVSSYFSNAEVIVRTDELDVRYN
ncbi:hypothetical protein [Fredinandcohnia onubensis]|uniref:hypothetical protein n=1 Tax=Fredinandcohnia onubensis TaxID=1571209 RepID=UPI000C0BFD93|nr:hypothetical protein [Fredinandcohnia onubensis]